jgi:hypothetical protein
MIYLLKPESADGPTDRPVNRNSAHCNAIERGSKGEDGLLTADGLVPAADLAPPRSGRMMKATTRKP